MLTVSFSVVFADEKDKTTSKTRNCIYACVETMQSSNSSPVLNPNCAKKDNDADSSCEPVPYNTISKRSAVPPNHCFGMHAEEDLSKQFVDKDDKGRRCFSKIFNTLGFGMRSNTGSSGQFKALSGKNVPAGISEESEEVLKSLKCVKDKQIECEPIFCDKDLCPSEEDIKRYGNKAVIHMMVHIWADFTTFMDEKTASCIYNLYCYDCCTALYMVGREIYGNPEVLNKLKDVNSGIGYNVYCEYFFSDNIDFEKLAKEVVNPEDWNYIYQEKSLIKERLEGVIKFRLANSCFRDCNLKGKYGETTKTRIPSRSGLGSI